LEVVIRVGEDERVGRLEKCLQQSNCFKILLIP
jgi:hypothetical protein